MLPHQRRTAVGLTEVLARGPTVARQPLAGLCSSRV